jgi:hypothetical protein
MIPPENLTRDESALKKYYEKVPQGLARADWFFPGSANLLIGGLQNAIRENGVPRKGQPHIG